MLKKNEQTSLFKLIGLPLGLAILIIGLIGAPAAGTTESIVSAAGVAAEPASQEKKKKKQRGKTVKARMVPSEPAAAEEEAAPAAEAATEEAATEEATVDVDPEPTRAERRAARKAEKAEREAAEQAARADADRAEAARAESARAEAARAEASRAEASRAEAARAEAAQTERAQAEAREVASRPAASTAEPTVSQSESSTTVATEAVEAAAADNSRTAAPAAVPAPSPAAAPRATRVAADPPRAAPPTRPRDVVRDRVVVREVLLDVLVNDRKGNPITGLGPADFRVTENGEAREVTSATFYGGDEFSGSGRDGEVRTDRYFIFMFHDLKQANPGLTASQIDAGRWATRWLEDGMLPNDQVAVVGYDVRLKLYQDFTRDRNEIAEAILAASRGGKDPDRWKSRSAPVFDPDSPSLFVNLPTGVTLSKATPKIQQAMELVGNAAEGIAGRKNLVLFSLGFGETRGTFGNYVPDPRYYDPMEQALNNGNVAVYAINTLGARRGGNTLTGTTDALSTIAQDTGGYYYSNHVNVKTPLKQMAKDNAAYYLISYRTEYPVGSQGYQDVKVETTADRAKVRARKGYRFGDSAER